MFSESFWENVIIAFTKLSMDQKQIKLRCTKERGDDETWAQGYVADFKKQVGKKLKHVFIDAKHERADEKEVEAFKDGVRKLEECVNTNVGFKTDAMKEVEMSLEFERQLRIRAESERSAALRSRERAKEKAVKLEYELRETKKELLELKERLNERIVFAGTDPTAISESNQAPSEMVTDNDTSITERRESSTLAHDIKRTRIERNQTTLELYKPEADQTDELDQGHLLVYGQPNEKEARTVVIVGAKNRGKSTFLNSFANYLWKVGVGQEHNIRFKISTTNQEKVMSHRMNNTHLDFNLTIVDVPSFPEDEKNSCVNDLMTHLQTMEITRVHSICFVVKSTDLKLSKNEIKIFKELEDLFKKRPDIISNFSDAAQPLAQQALRDAGVFFDNCFKFNNHNATFFIENPDEQDWKKAQSSFDEFASHLGNSEGTKVPEFDSKDKTEKQQKANKKWYKLKF